MKEVSLARPKLAALSVQSVCVRERTWRWMGGRGGRFWEWRCVDETAFVGKGPGRLKKKKITTEKIQDMQVDKVQTLRIAKLGSCAVCQASLAGSHSETTTQRRVQCLLELQIQSNGDPSLVLKPDITVHAPLY